MLEIKLWVYISEVVREGQKKVTLVPQCKIRRENIHFSKNREGLESEGKVSAYTVHGLGKHLEIEILSSILPIFVKN